MYILTAVVFIYLFEVSKHKPLTLYQLVPTVLHSRFLLHKSSSLCVYLFLEGKNP